MPTSIFVLLCAALIVVSVTSAVSIFFVTKLVGSVSRLKASTNIWEYQALERAAKIGSKAVEEQVADETESGQTQSDGTLTDAAAESLAKII